MTLPRRLLLWAARPFRRLPSRALLAGMLLASAACVPPDFPDEPLFSAPEDLAPPELVPLDPAVAEAAASGPTPEAEAELQARGASLRDRADALRRAPR